MWPIDSDGDTPEEHEDVHGQPPTVRSREEIPNVNGIISYDIQVLVDHDGGRSIVMPTNVWTRVNDFMVAPEKNIVQIINLT